MSPEQSMPPPPLPDWVVCFDAFELFLCQRLSKSTSPQQYLCEHLDCLFEVTSRNDGNAFSMQSLWFDVKKYHFMWGSGEKCPEDARPSDSLHPRIATACVSAPLTVEPVVESFEFCTRLADQTYNLLRASSRLPYKPILHALRDHDLPLPKYLSAADRQIFELLGEDRCRVMYLEDTKALLLKHRESLEQSFVNLRRMLGGLKRRNEELAEALAKAKCAKCDRCQTRRSSI